MAATFSWSKHLELWLYPLSLPPTPRAFIAETLDADCPRPGESSLYENQAYRHFIRVYVKAIWGKGKWADLESVNETPSATKLIRILGRSGSRNLMAALANLKLKKKGLSRAKSAATQVQITDLLKHAIFLVDLSEDGKLGVHPQSCFDAGFLWDRLRVLLQENGHWKGKLLNYYNEVWEITWSTALKAQERARQIRDLRLGSQVIPAFFALGAGRILMAALFGDAWFSILEKLKGLQPLSPLVQTLVERREFGTDHGEAASVMASFLEPFWGIEQAIYAAGSGRASGIWLESDLADLAELIHSVKVEVGF